MKILKTIVCASISFFSAYAHQPVFSELEQRAFASLHQTIEINSHDLIDIVACYIAGQRQALKEIPDCVASFYQELIQGKTNFVIQDLLENIAYIAPWTHNELFEDVRASRPDAALVTSPNAIAGNSCDLTQVIKLLGIIRSHIGTVFQEPAERTVLATLGNPTELGPHLNIVRKLLRIQEEFRETWTILANLTVTATTDLSGVFTALDACCDNITNEFQQTWTILANLTVTATVDLTSVLTTLNACCNNITNEFQQTWTILNKIDNDIINGFNGTFTAINACCTFTTLESLRTLIISDFNQTWTILNKIDNDVISGFNGTFTALNACCNNITNEFQQTWTILNKIDNDVINGFNGTFTAINACCTFTTLESLRTLIISDFNQTWTILNKIDNDVINGFNGTFTVLNDINNSLTTCCANITSEFQQTWTILANLQVTVDLSSVFTVLNKIDNDVINGFNGTFTALNACCNNITNEFQQTWTILNKIDNDVINGFNGTFTAINACCTFTTLESLRTLIISDFNQTWTILNKIDNDVISGFNGTFTALNACCNNITSEFQQTWTILAAGFGGTYTLVTTDFQETWTILAGLTSCTVPQSISSPTTITQSGNYCLQNDIAGNIVIAADRVDLNLNGKQITGSTSINGNNDIAIYNGVMTAGAPGLSVTSAKDVIVYDVVFNANTATGGLLIQTCTNVQVHDCSFLSTPAKTIDIQSSTLCSLKSIVADANSGNQTIRVLNSNNIVIEDLYASNNTSTTMLALVTSANCSIKNYRYNTNTTTANQIGLLIQSCGSILVEDSEFMANISSAGIVGLQVLLGSSVIIENCSITNNQAATSFSGITFTNPNNFELRNSSILNNSGATIATGVSVVSGQYGIISNNIAMSNLSSGGTSTGFNVASGTNISLFANQATNHTTNDFSTAVGGVPIAVFTVSTSSFAGGSGRDLDNISIVP